MIYRSRYQSLFVHLAADAPGRAACTIWALIANIVSLTRNWEECGLICTVILGRIPTKGKLQHFFALEEDSMPHKQRIGILPLLGIMSLLGCLSAAANAQNYE